MRSYFRSRIGTVVLTVAVTMFLLVAGRNFSSVSHAQAPTTTTTTTTIWDGMYTEVQAERGKTLYADQCAVCHGDTPVGGAMGPGLTGDDFMASFKDSNVGDVFSRIFKTMPANDPETLKPEQVADLIAFLAMSNAWPAGAKELPSEPEALKQIRIVVKE